MQHGQAAGLAGVSDACPGVRYPASALFTTDSPAGAAATAAAFHVEKLGAKISRLSSASA